MLEVFFVFFDVDVFVVFVGGGGLFVGIVVVVKVLCFDVFVIGVEFVYVFSFVVLFGVGKLVCVFVSLLFVDGFVVV